MSNRFGEGSGEFRVVGPPGTGKTEAAKGIAIDSAQEFGFDRVLITSFTKAAAAEIASRADLPEENIGTLHHFGLHLLRDGGDDRKVYTKSPDFIKKFNVAHPRYAITGRRSHSDDDDENGRALLEKRDRLMGKMTPPEMWPAEVKHFDSLWEKAKQQEHAIDFQDMMTAAYDSECAPGNPDVIIADEAQDLSKQQVEIVRKWGRNAKRVFFIGDDDQTIYRWRAASSEAMMHPVLEDWRYRYLSQSFRVPRQVHRAAIKWIEKINPLHRLHKDYKPRDFEGLVRPIMADYRDPEPLIVDALRQIKAGRSVMFLGTCGYMLKNIIEMLCHAGIPFANRYISEGDEEGERNWNPLRETELMKGILAFLQGMSHPRGVREPRPWSVGELLTWADCLKGMSRDWKGKHELLVDAEGMRIPDDMKTTERTLDLVVGKKLDELFDALESVAGSPLQFFSENLKKNHTKILESLGSISKIHYVENIIKRSGAPALFEVPQVTVGTIHSVKGGEADAVYLCQDLSPSQQEEWRGEAGREDLIRLFYVGMTRAKEQLIVMAPEDQYSAVDLLA